MLHAVEFKGNSDVGGSTYVFASYLPAKAGATYVV